MLWVKGILPKTVLEMRPNGFRFESRFYHHMCCRQVTRLECMLLRLECMLLTRVECMLQSPHVLPPGNTPRVHADKAAADDEQAMIHLECLL